MFRRLKYPHVPNVPPQVTPSHHRTPSLQHGKKGIRDGSSAFPKLGQPTCMLLLSGPIPRLLDEFSEVYAKTIRRAPSCVRDNKHILVQYLNNMRGRVLLQGVGTPCTRAPCRQPIAWALKKQRRLPARTAGSTYLRAFPAARRAPPIFGS